MFILLKGSHTYVYSPYEHNTIHHAIHKGSHTYVCYPYNCMNMQYIHIKEAIHMFILLTIAV